MLLSFDLFLDLRTWSIKGVKFQWRYIDVKLKHGIFATISCTEGSISTVSSLNRKNFKITSASSIKSFSSLSSFIWKWKFAQELTSLHLSLWTQSPKLIRRHPMLVDSIYFPHLWDNYSRRIAWKLFYFLSLLNKLLLTWKMRSFFNSFSFSSCFSLTRIVSFLPGGESYLTHSLKKYCQL